MLQVSARAKAAPLKRKKCHMIFCGERGRHWQMERAARREVVASNLMPGTACSQNAGFPRRASASGELWKRERGLKEDDKRGAVGARLPVRPAVEVSTLLPGLLL
ncbi:hypothetical protein C3F00_036695, partial [Pseudomonas sp. MWU13-2860]